jgi:hypothetical protein
MLATKISKARRRLSDQFDSPSENTDFQIDSFGQFLANKDSVRIHHTKPTIQLPPWRIVIQVLNVVSSK